MEVKAKGPVPSYCADCRRKRTRKPPARPKLVNCERCGAEVTVKSRGPVPRFCRGGCKKQPRKTAASNGQQRPAEPKPRAPASGARPATSPVLRPWDMAGREPAKAPRRETPRQPVPSHATAVVTALPATPPTITRIDLPDPELMVGREDLNRRLRLQQIRHTAAIVAWVAVVIVIGFMIYVGSRPAPPDFDSFVRLIA